MQLFSNDRLVAGLFVVIWATGFIMARFIAPHADPLTFLTIRFALAALILAAIAFVMRAPWPKGAAAWWDALVAGILLQGIYLGGVFWAIRHGLPAGISSLIVGLQPLVTAILAQPLLGERVGPRQWLGTIIGFAGALLVLSPKLGTGDGFPLATVAVSVVSLLAITLGTIWQKRKAAKADLRTNAAVQFIGATIVTAPAALLGEDLRFDGSLEVWIGLLWATLGLSVGAILLLLGLIKRGGVASVTTLFYLVPPVSALMAFALFGESLALLQIAGMVLAAIGVALATSAKPLPR